MRFSQVVMAVVLALVASTMVVVVPTRADVVIARIAVPLVSGALVTSARRTPTAPRCGWHTRERAARGSERTGCSPTGPTPPLGRASGGSSGADHVHGHALSEFTIICA
jgi:hypothetical protein